ncbi:MAG: DNA adenine methylase [Candidatus Hydrogenedentes bacterium]|nr:DNA adenine methylase [Candidatus Hydrogenedentota bacterium]
MMRRASTRVTPRPFLKWVGGKGQLLEELLARVDKAGDFGRYHEPFVGGGALFFELARLGRLGRKKAFLSDTNNSLIETYEAVKEDVDAVIALLQDHKKKHSEQYFYEVRASVPSKLIARAARIIYLNKTCFNGLYRENSKGKFNTPFGKYKNPLICDEENLRAVSKALSVASLKNQAFDHVLEAAKPGDLVYFDPPYHPISKTASFTSYDKSGFGEDAQQKLADVFAELHHKGVLVLLSNSYTPLIQQLYKDRGFRIGTVQATRLVNSRADRRGKISEALIQNF